MVFSFYDAPDRFEHIQRAHELALDLLEEVERSGLIRAGVSEMTLSAKVHALAREKYGLKRHWHKRVVRAGPNTLHPYADTPLDRVIGTDDILFIDIGPVFDGWEADIGRTYVLGNDAAKLRLRDAVGKAWQEGRDHFHANAETITGADLFAFSVELAERYGYIYGGPHAGHLVGNFPHESLQGRDIRNYIHADNKEPMTSADGAGQPRSWIYEIHFVDRDRNVGAFFEQWLDFQAEG
jgi:Xaa-Pro dipeptidase